MQKFFLVVTAFLIIIAFMSMAAQEAQNEEMRELLYQQLIKNNQIIPEEVNYTGVINE